MTSWSQDGMNIIDEINFDNIVTDDNMRAYLGYVIPEDKVLLDKKGRSMKKKKTDVPEASVPGSAPKKAPVTKIQRQSLVGSKPRCVLPMRDAKQPITAIAREVVLKV
jgi:hypothetical protein